MGRRGVFLLGMAAGFGAALVLFFLIAVAGLVAWSVGTARDEETTPELARATLTVAEDGCGVVREGPEPVPPALQWTIRDPQGFSVLERGAEGEDRYRYFAPGDYTVVLRAHDGEGYVEVSNSVEISCP